MKPTGLIHAGAMVALLGVAAPLPARQEPPGTGSSSRDAGAGGPAEKSAGTAPDPTPGTATAQATNLNGHCRSIGIHCRNSNNNSSRHDIHNVRKGFNHNLGRRAGSAKPDRSQPTTAARQGWSRGLRFQPGESGPLLVLLHEQVAVPAVARKPPIHL